MSPCLDKGLLRSVQTVAPQDVFKLTWEPRISHFQHYLGLWLVSSCCWERRRIVNPALSMAKAALTGCSGAGSVIPNSKFSVKTLIPGLSFCFRQSSGWMEYSLSEVMHLPLFKAGFFPSIPVSKLLFSFLFLIVKSFLLELLKIELLAFCGALSESPG